MGGSTYPASHDGVVCAGLRHAADEKPARKRAALRRLFARGAAPEALDLAAGIDDTLLARVERVAVRADVDAQLLGCRSGQERRAACRAGHARIMMILGMNVRLHLILRGRTNAHRIGMILSPPVYVKLPPHCNCSPYLPR